MASHAPTRARPRARAFLEWRTVLRNLPVSGVQSFSRRNGEHTPPWLLQSRRSVSSPSGAFSVLETRGATCVPGSLMMAVLGARIRPQ